MECEEPKNKLTVLDDMHNSTTRCGDDIYKCVIKTTIIGDSQAKYLYQQFNAYSTKAPAFITYSSGRRFLDMMQLLEYMSETVHPLLLHIGTNKHAKDGAQASLEHLHELLRCIRSARPEIRHMYVGIVLNR
ncbi:hypothetical protein HPB47_018726 [Ixodes persulcatus]|uniref:Uncharacterized protein n=1 Tax=Ixodes persulcatus TaxID=34615 RepID=A0AC60QZU1_IXOPE|nr:hypothetical protein HPB47_018726 [Ixodes persulcatus]